MQWRPPPLTSAPAAPDGIRLARTTAMDMPAKAGRMARESRLEKWNIRAKVFDGDSAHFFLTLASKLQAAAPLFCRFARSGRSFDPRQRSARSQTEIRQHP